LVISNCNHSSLYHSVTTQSNQWALQIVFRAEELILRFIVGSTRRDAVRKVLVKMLTLWNGMPRCLTT